MKKINWFLIIILVLVSFYPFISIKNSNLVYAYQESQISILESYQDIVGYLKIIGTPLESYIVQYTDNEYYLNHNINKEKDKYGAIFLDYRTNLDDSKKNIIYGHMSSQNKTIFSNLKNYLNEDYFKKYQTLEITSLNKKYTYHIFGVAIYDRDYDYLKVNFNKDSKYEENLQSFLSKTKYYDKTILSSADKTIFLQTCYPKRSGSYIIIGAKEISSANL